MTSSAEVSRLSKAVIIEKTERLLGGENTPLATTLGELKEYALDAPAQNQLRADSRLLRALLYLLSSEPEEAQHSAEILAYILQEGSGTPDSLNSAVAMCVVMGGVSKLLACTLRKDIPVGYALASLVSIIRREPSAARIFINRGGITHLEELATSLGSCKENSDENRADTEFLRGTIGALFSALEETVDSAVEEPVDVENLETVQAVRRRLIQSGLLEDDLE
jgi:hypothetical protein